MTSTITYANGREVTPADPAYRTRDALEEAYRTGGTDALTRYFEEIPPELVGLVNRCRTLCTRVGAEQRTPESIAQELVYEFRTHTLDEWTL